MSHDELPEELDGCVLFFDQFEEVFTLLEDETDRKSVV